MAGANNSANSRGPKPKNVAVLGATGSIGRSALEVIAASEGRLRASLISGHTQLKKLAAQARQFEPSLVVATDEDLPTGGVKLKLPPDTQFATGHDALAKAVAADDIDVVLAGIVGAAGLCSTWAALEAGKTVALANKETLVTAGPVVRPLIKKSGATLLPVDSEHAAIHQAMRAGQPKEVERIILTASGGPFRTWPLEELRQVTVDDALSHPTWDMGEKITVDSATMMNKALEIVEARWLFDLPAERIRVMIHPQSVVHSMVEFVDGSVVAQLSPPDMKLPIQYALEYPDRHPGTAARMDWSESHRWEFDPPDTSRFPAIALGYECAEKGGSSGAVLNAANEAAVAAFLEGDLHFTEIVLACRSVLESHNFEPNPTLDDLQRLDQWARQEVSSWVCA